MVDGCLTSLAARLPPAPVVQPPLRAGRLRSTTTSMSLSVEGDRVSYVTTVSALATVAAPKTGQVTKAAVRESAPRFGPPPKPVKKTGAGELPPFPNLTTVHGPSTSTSSNDGWRKM